MFKYRDRNANTCKHFSITYRHSKVERWNNGLLVYCAESALHNNQYEGGLNILRYNYLTYCVIVIRYRNFGIKVH